MSESWITLTDSDVMTADAAERGTVVAIKKRDDLGEICAAVTEEVRQAYLFSNRDLGPDGTIPSGLRARAIAMAIWRFVSEGLPRVEKLQTKERQEAATAARDYLAQIASADIGKVSAPSVGRKRRLFSLREQDGI